MKKLSLEEKLNEVIGMRILKSLFIFLGIMIIMFFIALFSNKTTPQDKIQLQVDSTKLDSPFEYVIDTIDDGAIYTTSSFKPFNPNIPMRNVTVVLPTGEHCFEVSITSIFKDGTISNYTNKHCSSERTDNEDISLHINNEAINFITICSYNEQHYVSQKATFVIVMT